MTRQGRILAFAGPHRFLSNFAAVVVEWDGDTYPSVEHAYQAAKTMIQAERKKIRVAPSAAAAKKLGRKVTLREDWDGMKLTVMRQLVRQKFDEDHPLLRAALLSTGDAELIEGNWWGDTFWGVYAGSGENWLGRILMEIREEIREAGRCAGQS